MSEPTAGSGLPPDLTLEVIAEPAAMQERSAELRRSGRRIAFVPTMGALHEGHLSLLKKAREHGDFVVLSVFVNPLQFGKNEDLGRYPRTLIADLRGAQRAGCELAFVPTSDAIYPPGFSTKVEVSGVSEGLCGARRPGHFVGVATVVLKLLNLVAPHAILLGEKDYQQLQVIRRMCRDLNVATTVVGCPLIRDSDGIALSSRNAYLSAAERAQALVLSRALFAARDAHAQGLRSAGPLVEIASRILAAEPALRLDYLELRDADTLAEVTGELDAAAVLLVAGYIGSTRLLDNVILPA